MVRAHGKHVYLDYIGYQHDGFNDGKQMLQIMLDSVNQQIFVLYILMSRSLMAQFPHLVSLLSYCLMNLTLLLIVIMEKDGLPLTRSLVVWEIQILLPIT